jgi:hypothetical protein
MTARKYPIEVIVDPKEDHPRALKMLQQKARNLRMSEDTKLAATGAKWEAAIHEALQAVMNRNGKKAE